MTTRMSRLHRGGGEEALAVRSTRSRKATTRRGSAAMCAAAMLIVSSVIHVPGARSNEPGAVFVVDTLVDDVDAVVGDGYCATARGSCSLRAALQEANATAGHDEIRLGPGEHVVDLPAVDETGPEADAGGDLDVLDTITIKGRAATRSVIRAGARFDDDLLEIHAEVVAEITDLTVRDSTQAAILVNGGDLIVTRSSVSHNATGIWFSWGFNLRVSDSIIADNTATGIVSRDITPEVVIERSTITGNENSGVRLYRGTIRDSLVSENRGSEGGGLYGSGPSGSLAIIRSTIRDNTAVTGAGVSVKGWIHLIDSAVHGNVASQSGGGIFTRQGGEIRNSTISGNRALAQTDSPTHSGGGVVTFDHLEIESSTLVGNTSPLPGATLDYNPGEYRDGFVTISNSILDSGTDMEECAQYSGQPSEVTLQSEGHNIVRDNTCGVPRASDFIGLDPLLEPLADNGGPTKSHLPRPASPAINNGTTDLATDQRGVRRPQLGRPDIGSIEFERPACSIRGTGGDDVLVGTRGDDVICAFGGNDVIRGLTGDDLIFGGPGDDVIRAGGGFDRVAAGPGNDLVRGGIGADVLIGGIGGDRLYGGSGDDLIRGSRGSDLVAGNLGDDLLWGGAGNDRVVGGVGHDGCWGGPGTDTLIDCETPP